jgi:hypothetical protein
MKESDIQTQIKDYLSHHPSVAWIVTTTQGRVRGKYRSAKTGMSDIIGQMKSGLFLAIEVKKPGEKPTPDQQEFLSNVSLSKGVAGCACCVEDVIKILKEGV